MCIPYSVGRQKANADSLAGMVQDAEKFAEEDELLKKKVESRNAVENLWVIPHVLSLSSSF